jgi:hypothetical protein
MYRAYIREHPEIVAGIGELIQGKSAALFCYERSTAHCHRGVLLQELGRMYLGLRVIDM